jgi:hypothetical protein
MDRGYGAGFEVPAEAAPGVAAPPADYVAAPRETKEPFMRRSVLALTVALAAMASLASVALAIGPGGWDHLDGGLRGLVECVHWTICPFYSVNRSE